MNTSILGYCFECGKMVECTTSIETVNETTGDRHITYKFPVSRCSHCNSEVDSDMYYQSRKAQARYFAYINSK